MRVSLSIFNSKKGSVFIFKAAVFFIVLILVDWGIGTAIGVLYRKAPHGANWTKENWLLDERFDVVIFGSSRAFRHYVPSVISGELGLSVFNAGQNGQYLLYSYALEQLMLERYAPKMIVLDILPSFIVKVDNPDEEFERLSTLSPYIANKEVRRLLTHDSFFEGLKYDSRMYRFNSKILSILDNFHSHPDNVDNGYEMIGDSRFHDRNPFILDTLEKVEIDSFKLNILHKFISSAREHGVMCVASFSPVSEPLSGRTHGILQFYSDIFADMNVPFLNFATSDYKNYMNKDLFIDIIHMDETGADIFSLDFAEKLLNLRSHMKSKLAVLD